MEIRILKFTAYLENSLCIYRNFCLYGIYIKALVMTRIVVELLLITANIVTQTIHYYHRPQCKNDVIYFYLTNFNSLAIIIFGITFSKHYKYLTFHLNAVNKLFGDDKGFLTSTKAKHSMFVMVLLIFISIKLVIFAFTQFNSKPNPDLPAFWHHVFQISMLMSSFRYIIEFLVQYCVLCVIAEQLKFVTSSIDSENVANNANNTLISEIERWSVIFKHVRESAKLFNHIFGIQLIIMLATALFYYIIFLYTLASESVTGRFTSHEMCVYLSTLVLMLCILYIVSRAAQLMENNADLLRRRLCKLLIRSLSSADCYKATKDFLRMMSTRPIRARAFGSINVDMTLLPTCVSFFTSYTIIALQFNNVL